MRSSRRCAASPERGVKSIGGIAIQRNDFDSTVSLKDKVYDTLKKDIMLGKFKAGEPLNILALTNALNISGAPIREALSMLHQDGFVVLTPRKKATVSEVSEQDCRLVGELRQMLEPYAAGLSAGKIPQRELDRVRIQLETVLQEPANRGAYIDSDLALHELLHAFAGSAVLSYIMTTIKEQSLRIRYCLEDAAREEQRMNTVVVSTREHLEILNALERGNADEIRRGVQQHLDNYIRRTQEHEGIQIRCGTDF